jgi:hypothetical protein
MAMGIRKVGDVYDSEWFRDEVVKAERGNREHIAKYDRSFYGHLAKLADERNPVTEETRSAIAPPSHRASQIADLLVESGSHPDRSAALDYLMHSSRGAALLSRLSKKESSPMESIEKLEAALVEKYEQLAKSSGVVAVAKHVLVEGPSGLTKDDFNRMCNADWQRDRRSGESYDQCFSRHYVAPEATDVRKVDQMLKAMPFQVDLQPLMVGGEANRGGDVNPNDPAEAIEQLKQLGRDRWPTASAADQFERALTAPEYHKLARVAVPIPRVPADGMYPYPR